MPATTYRERLAIGVYLLSLGCGAFWVHAANNDGMDRPTRLAASEPEMLWWREAKFGLFVHWGPVSLKGTEIGWSRGNQVPIEEYDQLHKRFNPTQFDADTWVRVAKDAGMKYLETP